MSDQSMVAGREPEDKDSALKEKSPPSLISSNQKPETFGLLSLKEMSKERPIIFLVGILVLLLGITPNLGSILGLGGNETPRIDVVLEFGNHPDFDPDNDGIANITEVIDFAFNASFGWNVQSQHLAAWWRITNLESNASQFLCNGAKIACSFVDMEVSSPQWNDPFYLYHGLHGASTNNSVGLQILYVNYSLDFENLSAAVYNSEWQSLAAVFIQPPNNANISTNSSNSTNLSDNSPPICGFPQIAIEKGANITLDLSSYCEDAQNDSIAFEVQESENISAIMLSDSQVMLIPLKGYEGKAILDVLADDGVNYTAASLPLIVYAPTNLTPSCAQIPNISVETSQITQLNLSAYCQDAQGNPLEYAFLELGNFTISMENGVASISPIDSFIGTQYSYFIANNSQFSAITNVFSITSILGAPQESLTQLGAEIGVPVTWRKTLSADAKMQGANITLLAGASNITVRASDDSGEKEIPSDSLQVIHSGRKTTLSQYERRDSPQRTFGLGALIAASEAPLMNRSEEPTLSISAQVREVTVEFQTEAPLKSEELLEEGSKRVIISSDFHYENVLAYADITPAVPENIRLYWIIGQERTPFADFTPIDSDSDGLADRIEWIVPHLSNQTFEIDIQVLNVQSYPMVGGNWTIAFTTTGSANLAISAINQTSYGEEKQDLQSTTDDLNLLELRCGNDTLFSAGNNFSASGVFLLDYQNQSLDYYSLEDSSLPIRAIQVEGYSCNSTAYWTVKVNTQGVHNQRLDFGNRTAYANNYALSGTVFVDDIDTDFTIGGNFSNTVSRGTGSGSNVTLNYTYPSGGNDRGNPFYNKTGNFTSRIFDTGQQHARIDRIAWEVELRNSSDVLGFATHDVAVDSAVFYRNGSYGADTTQGNFLAATALSYTNAVNAYSVPAGWSREDLLGFGAHIPNNDLYAFFRNGSTLTDANRADYTADASLASASTWTMPADVNVSQIIGFTVNDDGNEGALFLNNGTFIVAAQDIPPFTFATMRRYTFSAAMTGFDGSDAIGVDYHAGSNDAMMLFRNGSRVMDTAQTSFATDIAFAAVGTTTYSSLDPSVNLTVNS
ncbi:MAG TPA: hypothetical protein VJB12_06205, partial [Candidatus Nanoarchaeia archaeon]|nr:hypothetical protein [Candidatus Nanoarchaeia archaeon]